ncbi:hypothetical protein M434DRAFT_169397 [Hypoxylon sp. CO27-5]|nr:hypothetical protein M434DRAFT_169397 [Hypoxylon sp. CO27-5]
MIQIKFLVDIPTSSGRMCLFILYIVTGFLEPVPFSVRYILICWVLFTLRFPISRYACSSSSPCMSRVQHGISTRTSSSVYCGRECTIYIPIV